MNFSLMYVSILLFYKICSLTYFHVKISVYVHEAKNICLAKKSKFETMFLFFEKKKSNLSTYK